MENSDGWCARLCRRWRKRDKPLLTNDSLDGQRDAMQQRWDELQERIGMLVNVRPPHQLSEYVTIISTINEGSYGTIFRVKLSEAGHKAFPWLDTQTNYAMKRGRIVDRSKQLDEVRKSLLQVSVERHAEWWRMMTQEQPNIIRVHAQIVEVGHSMNSILEVLDGPDLFDWVQKYGAAVNESSASKLFHQAVTAVHHLHRCLGALHRDIKLENFGFTHAVPTLGPWPTLKLFDLGLAWIYPEPITEETSRRLLHLLPCGTMHWMAPEVWAGVCGPPSDVWSLGLLVHYLLKRDFPFDLLACRKPKQVVRALQRPVLTFDEYDLKYVSLQARQFLKSLLCKDPEQRATTSDILSDPWFLESTSPPTSPKQPKALRKFDGQV